MTTQTIIITGETYVNRRELRRLGALWNQDAKGYVAPPQHRDAIEKFAASTEGLTVAPFKATDEDVTAATGERLRELRQARLDRYRDRLLSRAASAERRGEEARARINPHEREFLSLFEPVKRGHHSQRRHEKLIERSQKSFLDAGREFSEAGKLRDRAESLGTAVIAGDAARRRQEARDRAAAQIGLGDKVRSVVYGDGVVTKVNKNSFTVNIESRGFIAKLDKSHVSLLEKGSPEAAKPARKFKAGDLVTATRGLSKMPGKILRATPRGYSVEYSYYSGFSETTVTRKGTFSECSLTPREA